MLLRSCSKRVNQQSGDNGMETRYFWLMDVTTNSRKRPQDTPLQSLWISTSVSCPPMQDFSTFALCIRTDRIAWSWRWFFLDVFSGLMHFRVYQTYSHLALLLWNSLLLPQCNSSIWQQVIRRRLCQMSKWCIYVFNEWFLVYWYEEEV